MPDALSGPEPLAPDHDLSSFDCGKPSLTDWLKRFALLNQRAHSAQTYVLHRRRVVVGFYSLTTGSVRREDAPERLAKGLARHPIGVIVLGRLAVDQSEQGRGLGSALLKDALTRAAAAGEIAAARAVLVHALDEDARRFYEGYDFEPFPGEPLTLFLLMKDLRAALGL